MIIVRNLAVICFLLLTGSLAAQETLLPLTDDAWVNGNNRNANFGGQSSLFLHNFGPKEVLIKFDAAAIVGAGISRATLRLTLTAAKAAGTVTVLEIDTPWSEATVTYANRPSPTGNLLPGGLAGTFDITGADLAALAGGPVIIEMDVTPTISAWAQNVFPPEGFLLETEDLFEPFLPPARPSFWWRRTARAQPRCPAYWTCPPCQWSLTNRAPIPWTRTGISAWCPGPRRSSTSKRLTRRSSLICAATR